MNKELQEALTICRENEAKRDEIYDKMYTFWKRNIQPCIEQSNKHVGERIYLPEKDIHIIIQSYFFNYHANRMQIIDCWPCVEEDRSYAPPELIIQAMKKYLEKTSAELSLCRSKLSPVHLALRKFMGENNE